MTETRVLGFWRTHVGRSPEASMTRSLSLSLSVLGTLVLGALVGGPALAAEGPKPLPIGSAAPDFDLPGVDGRRYSLADFADARVLVVIFTADHCPTAQAYEERIEKLDADFRGRGVRFVLISPNDPLALRLDEQGYSDLGDTLDEMRIRARDRGWTFPYLYDGETQKTSREYGPQATPHVFVFDQERKLRYAGRVDDNQNPAKATTSDARDAIEAVLAGRPVPVETTKTFGCSIKWAEKRDWVKKGFEDWAKEEVELEPTDLAGVRALVRNDSDKLRLVDVWATWCGPCVIEFPELVKVNRIYRGREFEVVTVNADAPEKRAKALAFLKEQQASTRNVTFEGADPYALVEAVDPEWGGGLPHTILVAPGGRVIYRSEGAFDALRLRRAIVGWLGRYYHSTPGGR
jgi:thiol-disulfide isomerase/thioredoxin